MAENQDKKLIIDDDWKKEAQKEKEVLAEKEKAQEEHGGRQGPLPEADFPTLVSMLATQAFFAMGLIRMKGEPQAAPDLEAAKYNIDILAMLETKTKGNLQPEEAKLLEETLYNLRMAFVQLTAQRSS